MSENREHIEELSFSNVIGDRFGRYSKYIIQDRALPDIRDGLKPVQRRILYAMYQERNTHQNPYRKSAKTVGNVIGNYHPHGDTSVYDAMVRMSQEWKNRSPLIDMHGNNGSMDGDPAAAMRYTEARLTPIASELLDDIDAETVNHGLNFDDTLEEPLVLPAKFPNLLVNGATGISAGYATDIPSHNLGEVIDAIIHILSHDNYQLKDLFKYIKGPDFPTGAILMGSEGLKEAYLTGRGRVVMRAKTMIENLRGGKSQIVATELPYDINKLKLIQKIDDIRIQGKIEGIAEVRDESDRNGLRLVIELKRDVDSLGILNYLLKNTDLQMNYNFNMVAIHHSRPVQANLSMILEAYIEHRQEVIRRRTLFHKNSDVKRLHIVDGLIRVVSILDEVIQTIRASQNKQDAKNNLVAEYDFSQEQAEAIVNLQLYRLTNTDIVSLQNERLELNEHIMMHEQILNHAEILNKVLIDELKEIKKNYASERLTQVEEKIEEITVDESLLIPKENVIVSVTQNGYYKRTSLRSFSSTETLSMGSTDLDQVIFAQQLSTYDALIIITNRGNYIHLPVNELPDIKWKDLGTHLSQNYLLSDNEIVIAAFPGLSDLEDQDKDVLINSNLVITTEQGMIKQVPLSEFVTYRSYKTKTSEAIILEDKDQVIAVNMVQVDQENEVLIITEKSYCLRYNLEEVSTYGLKAKGVKAINLKEGDKVIASLVVNLMNTNEQVLVLSQKGHIKKFKPQIINNAKRGSRGQVLFKELKRDPHRLIFAQVVNDVDHHLIIQGDTGIEIELSAQDVPSTQRLSNGSPLENLGDLGQIIGMFPNVLKNIT